MRHNEDIPGNASMFSSQQGFTLLEILVAFAVLGIAIIYTVQLFSSNLHTISISGDYISATIAAESKMSGILDNDKLVEKSWSEASAEGYQMDITITETLKEKTENLSGKIMEIDLTMWWPPGTRKKSITLRTLKFVDKTDLK